MLRGPRALEHFHGRTGHVHVIVLFIPKQMEIAPWQVRRTLALCPTRKNAGHTAGAGPCAAGLRDATAAFPCDHSDFMRADDLYPMGIGAIGKHRMGLNGSPQLCQGNTLEIISK